MQDSLYSEGFKFTKMEDNRIKKPFGEGRSVDRLATQLSAVCLL